MTYADPILKHFNYEHLPPHPQRISKPFCDLARALCNFDGGEGSMGVPDGEERHQALRKLLEAKDCAVRAAIL